MKTYTNMAICRLRLALKTECHELADAQQLLQDMVEVLNHLVVLTM